MDKSALEALISRLEVWALIFGVIVAIGVAGESVYGIRLWWNNRKLQAMQASEAESQRLAIAELTEKTATANARAAEATAKTEATQLEVEKLRAENLKLEEENKHLSAEATLPYK
jgi:hypothetical protein